MIEMSRQEDERMKQRENEGMRGWTRLRHGRVTQCVYVCIYMQIYIHTMAGPCFDVIDGVSGAHDEWTPKLKAMIRQKYFPKAAADSGINALLGSHDQVGCRKNGGRNEEGRLSR
jgi:hypothetical protein